MPASLRAAPTLAQRGRRQAPSVASTMARMPGLTRPRSRRPPRADDPRQPLPEQATLRHRRCHCDRPSRQGPPAQVFVGAGHRPVNAESRSTVPRIRLKLHRAAFGGGREQENAQLEGGLLSQLGYPRPMKRRRNRARSYSRAARGSASPYTWRSVLPATAQCCRGWRPGPARVLLRGRGRAWPWRGGASARRWQRAGTHSARSTPPGGTPAWARSGVVPSATLERRWYLEQYKFGSASRADRRPSPSRGRGRPTPAASRRGRAATMISTPSSLPGGLAGPATTSRKG